MKGSIWLETAPDAPSFPHLDRNVRTSVAVIGGGIVGVTTALLLAEAGVPVVLIEANRIGHGVTGHTTGKVSSQHGIDLRATAVQARRRCRPALRRRQPGGAGVDRGARRE